MDEENNNGWFKVPSSVWVDQCNLLRSRCVEFGVKIFDPESISNKGVYYNDNKIHKYINKIKLN